ncbi:MFS transporter [Pseudomonas putida]|uniref:MFS transporter n=1 Tax=Pseudomonas putida TaxID=303 RepID=UPI0018AA17A0|nr:MFS transporter [Pseudomonas putida]MBF8668353.1 MFS transporter [Pseudomonas putida]MBF8710828.1 MFS transporter [Pseudomonas putida]
MQNTVFAGARLDRLPLSGYHWRLFLLIGAGLFLDAFDVYLGGAVTGALLKSGWSTLELNAWFTTATFAGLTIGAYCAGIVGDRYGRRFAYQLNLMIFGGASIAAAFAPDMHWLIGIRFIMGIGMGAEIVISYGMLSEFVPSRYRGRLLAGLSLLPNSAVFAASFSSMWIIPNFGWRVMFAIVGVGAVLVWLLRKNMPESPRWLESQGRFKEAESVLAAIETSVGRGRELPDYQRIAPQPAQKVPLNVLFTPPVLSRTLAGSLIMITVGYCIYGLLNWLPSFFVAQGIEIVESLTYTTVMSIGAPVGTVIGILIADRVGRRPAIVGAALVSAVLGLCYLNAASTTTLLAAGFLLIAGVYVLIAVGQCAFIPELFATSYRMRGVGVCNAAGRGASALCQFLILALFTMGGVNAVVASVVGLLAFLAVVVWLLRIETSGVILEKADTGEGSATFHNGKGVKNGS